MQRRYIITLIILTYALQIKALGSAEIERADSFSQKTLSIVYGWYRNAPNNKWVTKEKEIKNIDKFADYHLLSFINNDNRYVAIVKESEEGKNVKVDTYVFSYDIYADEIKQWQEDAIIRLPIIKHHQVVLKRGDELTARNLGINNLSSANDKPDKYFVLQYKFFSDATVKFLFYTESCSATKCTVEGLNTNEKYLNEYKEIGNDSLYDNFFYKTTVEYFTQFIDSPFNNKF